MNIIKLSKNNVKDLVKLHKRCVKETNSFYYPPDAIEEWLDQITENNVEKQMKNSTWYLALEKDRLVAFAQYSTEDGYLFQINVHPKHQRKGIGKTLYGFVEDKFIKSKCKTIKLNATLNAVDFYKSVGFKKKKKILFPLDKTRLNMVSMIKHL